MKRVLKQCLFVIGQANGIPQCSKRVNECPRSSPSDDIADIDKQGTVLCPKCYEAFRKVFGPQCKGQIGKPDTPVHKVPEVF